MSAAILDSLGYITRLDEVRGLVPDDPGEIVRHAQPLDEQARRQLKEQWIARLQAQGRDRS